MNRRQIIIIWLGLTLFLPAIYFGFRVGIDTERKIRENRDIREGGTTESVSPRRFHVSFEKDGKPVVYEIESSRYPSSESEIERLLATGRQLSDLEVAAWKEKEEIERSRRGYWEVFLTASFVFISLILLFTFCAQAKNTKEA